LSVVQKLPAAAYAGVRQRLGVMRARRPRVRVPAMQRSPGTHHSRHRVRGWHSRRRAARSGGPTEYPCRPRRGSSSQRRRDDRNTDRVEHASAAPFAAPLYRGGSRPPVFYRGQDARRCDAVFFVEDPLEPTECAVSRAKTMRLVATHNEACAGAGDAEAGERIPSA